MARAYADARGALAAARAQMHLGELLHVEGFSLFDSMAALEVMDPRLDAGMKRPDDEGAEEPAGSVAEAVAAGRAPLELGAASTLAVLDEVLALEAGWYTGYSLAQTVLTCLYVHDLERTTAGNPVLGAYCTATWHAVCAAKTLLETSSVHEEEDFVTYTFGLPGDSPTVGEGHAASLALAKTEESIEALGDAPADEAAPAHAPAAWKPAERRAVLKRLRMRRLHLNSLLWVIEAEGPVPADGVKALTLALAALDELRDAYAQDGCEPTEPSAQHGFDESVTRRLLAPAPPRKITIARGSEALVYLRGVLEQLQSVARLDWDSSSGALGLLEMLGRVAPSLKSCLSRGALAKRLETGPSKLVMGVCSPLAMVASDVWLSPTPVPTDVDSLLTFLRSGVTAVTNVARVKLCNRGRHRRRLLHCLEDCEVMAQDAAVVDYPAIAKALEAQSSSWRETPWAGAMCRTYTTLLSTSLQLQHLLLGCELKLYHEAELSMFYWYCDYLLGMMGEGYTQLITSGFKALEAEKKDAAEKAEKGKGGGAGEGSKGGGADAKAASGSGSKAGKKDKKKQAKKDKAGGAGGAAGSKSTESKASQAMRRKLASLQSLAILSEARRWCFRGIVRLLAALEVGGHTREWDTKMNGGRERFEQRYVVLHRVTLPPPLQYESYLKSTDASSFDQTQLLTYAGECFQSTVMCLQHYRKHQHMTQGVVELDAECKALMRAAMTNKTTVEVLKKEGDANATDLKVCFEYLGGHYAIAKLSRTQGPASPIVGE